MKYIFTLLITITLSQFTASAQRNFKPGYIVSLKGDTTKGFIDRREWSQGPQNVTFTTNVQSPGKELTATDVAGFGINGLEHYRTYLGPISVGSLQPNKLNYLIDSSSVVKSVFLRVLVTGKNAALLSYEDEIKNRFFIAEKYSPTIELMYFRHLSEAGAGKIENIYSYRTQLQRLVSKYQTGNKILIDRVQMAAYEANDLKKVILMINNNENLMPEQKTDRTGSQFFIGTGANVTQYTFSKINLPETKGASVSSAFPFLNAGIDLFFNKDIKKLVFRAEVSATASKLSYSTPENVNGYSLSFNQLSASISPQMLYNFYNKPDFKLYLGAGVAYSMNTYSNHHFYGIYYLGGNRTEGSDVKRPLGSTFNFITKVGATVKNVEIFASYSIQSPNGYYFENVAMYRAGINYHFGKKQ